MSTETRWTRADYMSGRVSHQAYYLSVAREAGISYEASAKLPEIKAALAAGDEHLNTIPLRWWDERGESTRSAIARALKGRDPGGCSLADLVCVHKCAARDAALNTCPQTPTI